MADNNIINARIQLKHDTEKNWNKAINFKPREGEVIVYSADNNYNYSRIKIGDGKTTVTQLPFIDENLQDKINNLILIQSDTPNKTNNKIWIKNNSELSYTIPTEDEMTNAISSAVSTCVTGVSWDENKQTLTQTINEKTTDIVNLSSLISSVSSEVVHFRGITNKQITDKTDPEIEGYVFGIQGAYAIVGDMIIDANGSGYIWTLTGANGQWKKIGDNSGYSSSTHTHGNIYTDGTLDNAKYSVVTDEDKKITTIDLTVEDSDATSTSDTTTFVQSVSQDSQGQISVIKASLDTTGTWSGNAATADKLSNTNDIGSTTHPVYFSASGIPTTTTYKMVNTNATDGTPRSISENLETGFWQVNGTNNTDLYSQPTGALLVNQPSSFQCSEIYQDYITGQLAIRSKNNGLWTSWRKVLDSTNYTNWAATSSHTHGNITNNGTINTVATIGNGCKLAIIYNGINASVNNQLTGSSITFDGSTETKCLTPKGTWKTFGTSNLTLGTTSDTALAGNTDINKVKISANVTDDSRTYPIVFASSLASVISEQIEILKKSSGQLYFCPSTGNLTSKKFNGYTLGAACEKGVTDNATATAVTNSDTNLITARTLYNAGYVKSSGITSITISATSPINSSTSTAQTSSSASTTISLSDGYGDTKNPYGKKSPNQVLAGPSSGTITAVPTFRGLVADDLPTVPYNKGGTGLTSLGSAGTVLKVNSAGNGLEWGTVSTTDVNVTQDYSTANNNYPLLMTSTSGIAQTTSRGATTTILNNLIYANPSSGKLFASAIETTGNISAIKSTRSEVYMQSGYQINGSNFNVTLHMSSSSDGLHGIKSSGYLTSGVFTSDAKWIMYRSSDGQAHSQLKIYGAVWNDYAEYRKTNNQVKPGQCVIDNDDGSLTITSKRLMPGAQIVTDTFGFAIGQTTTAQTPLAVSGRVLVYTNRPREQYHAGMAVCSAPNGTVDIMTREEIQQYPDCIIGIVSEIPSYKVWGSDNINVNGRIWIKIK